VEVQLREAVKQEISEFEAAYKIKIAELEKQATLTKDQLIKKLNLKEKLEKLEKKLRELIDKYIRKATRKLGVALRDKMKHEEMPNFI